MCKKHALERIVRVYAKVITLTVTGVGGCGRLQVIFTFLFMHGHVFHLCITFIARQNNKAISILSLSIYI